jgi:hypothetical protein
MVLYFWESAMKAFVIAFLATIVAMTLVTPVQAEFTDNPRSHYCGTTKVAWKDGCRPTVPCPPGMHGRFGGDRAFNIKNCH